MFLNNHQNHKEFILLRAGTCTSKSVQKLLRLWTKDFDMFGLAVTVSSVVSSFIQVTNTGLFQLFCEALKKFQRRSRTKTCLFSGYKLHWNSARLFTYFTSLSTCVCCSFTGHNKTNAPFTSVCIDIPPPSKLLVWVCVSSFLPPQHKPSAPSRSLPCTYLSALASLFTYFAALSTCVCFHSVSFLWVQQNKRSSLEHDSSL